MNEKEPLNVPELWIRQVIQDFLSLPAEPTEFSEELVDLVARANQSLSVAVQNGHKIGDIQKLPSYQRYKDSLELVRSHNESMRAKGNEEFEKAQKEHQEFEATILEEARSLEISESFLEAAKEYISVADNEFDNFEKWSKALSDWKKKTEDDLRYLIAYNELRGKRDEALELRVRYVRRK